MPHPAGASELGDACLDFVRRVCPKFHDSKISSDSGLLLFRELEDALGLHALAGDHLNDARTAHLPSKRATQR